MTRKRFTSFLIAACIVAGGALVSPAQQTRPAIAVNDFKAEALESSSARIITERIRSELVNSGLFRVIERAEMDNILREQGFQQSGACDDQNCLVEVGQLLGVDRMIAGSIGKLGNMYTMSMRMIDVGSSEIVATVTEDCTCAIEDLVSSSVPAIVRKLARHLETEQEGTGATTPVAGILRISTEPQGARLSLDGKVMGSTPYENTQLSSGEYALRLELDGYERREEQILVNPKAPLELLYSLTPSGATKGSRSRRGRIIRRIAFGTGAGICALAGARLNQMGRNAHDEYSRLPANASVDLFDKQWQEVQSLVRMRNASYITSSVLAVGFTISLFR